MHKFVDFIVVAGENERVFESVSPEYLGIGYIKSYLKEKGINSKIHTLTFNAALRIWEQFPEREPVIVGFPLFATNTSIVCKASRLLKEKFPNVHITIGGPNTANYSLQILHDNPWVDSVVEGEGEETMWGLAQRVFEGQSLQGCLGVSYRDSGLDEGVRKNSPRPLIENLDALPFPDRSVLDRNPNIICSVMSSRGCSAFCTFCRAIVQCEKKELQVRACSVKRFVDEIEHLDANYPIELFVFWDSTFNDPLSGGNERMLEFAREIKQRNLDISFITNTRAELITEDSREALKELAKVGMVSIEIGIEAGNNKDLKLYGKPASLNDNERALKIIRDAVPYVNIKPEFISVNPYTDYETLLKNFNFLHSVSLGFHVQRYLSVLYVYPQAAIRNKLIKDGLMSEETSYDTDPLNYQFIDQKVGELCHIFNENLKTPKFDGIELLEKMLSILRAKVYRRLFQLGVQRKKYDALFKTFDRLRAEENNKNHTLLCHCIKYLIGETSKEDVILWCRELNRTKFLYQLNVLFRKLFWSIFSEKTSLNVIKNKDSLPLIAKMMGVPIVMLNMFLLCAKLSALIKRMT